MVRMLESIKEFFMKQLLIIGKASALTLGFWTGYEQMGNVIRPGCFWQK
jgi:hypothetical protein